LKSNNTYNVDNVAIISTRRGSRSTTEQARERAVRRRAGTGRTNKVNVRSVHKTVHKGQEAATGTRTVITTTIRGDDRDGEPEDELAELIQWQVRTTLGMFNSKILRDNR
jgi:hypothetical protein